MASAALTKARRRWRAMVWSAAAILALAMVLPMGGYVYVDLARAQQQAQPSDENPWERPGENPRSMYWRQVRQGQDGSVGQPMLAGDVLIQNGGQNWRQLRNGPVATYTPWLMAASLILITLFHLAFRPGPPPGSRSGELVPRWSLWDRTVHWVTATLFIVLSITGLSLLFGRAVLAPVFGAEGFAAYAGFAKTLHNYSGPFFVAAIVAMILTWIWFNVPNRVDLQWFARGGGYLDKHVSAGKSNGGEKVWFWFVVLVGGAVCITGLIMNFPNFGQARETMQISNLIHSVASIAWVALFFGHVYMAAWGGSGALEGMTTGYVSAEWAKHHHDLWYEQVKDKAIREGGEKKQGGSASARPT